MLARLIQEGLVLLLAATDSESVTDRELNSDGWRKCPHSLSTSLRKGQKTTSRCALALSTCINSFDCEKENVSLNLNLPTYELTLDESMP